MTHANQPRIAIEHRSITDLTADPRNARVHSKRQLAQIAASIGEFGFVNPVLVDPTGLLIAGHGRFEAAKQLGLESVPAITLSHLSPAQRRALALADNKIAANAGWDDGLLAEALSEIMTLDVEFNTDAIGFETAEIDLLLETPQKMDPADEPIEPDNEHPPVTRPGDLWLLGEHRILCGDALALESYERLMGTESARLVVTDPPYNVAIDGHVSGLGKAQHHEFAMASGEMSTDQFTGFLTQVFHHLARYTVSGAVVMAFMDWRHMREMLTAGGFAFTELLNLCVWSKTNAGMGSFYRSQHELVFVFKSGKGKHLNTIELGRHGRYRTNVWSYAGANSFGRNRDEDLADHPTVKPTIMIADAIKDASKRGDIVLDPFGGSGTAVLAAERTGRIARVIELDPRYVDVALKRWMKMLPGREPTLAQTGERFDVVIHQREA